MKTLLLLCTVFYTVYYAASSPTSEFHPLSDEFINHINSQQSSWKAGRNFDRKYPLESIKRMMGVRKDKKYQLPIVNHKIRDLPDEFDARTQWSNCTTIGEVGDQAGCGSCWAFGAVEAISDRICIHSEGKTIVRISAQDLTSCCGSCGFGCDGGYPGAAWDYWQETGIVSGGAYGTTDTCYPYKKAPCEHHMKGDRPDCSTEDPDTPDCERKCIKTYDKEYKADKHFGKSAYNVDDDEEAIKTEIFQNGPVEAAFDVFEDFLQYKSGVYKHVSGSFLGGHAIKIFGWGNESGNKFWWVANSWNTDWGDKGYFKILRGEDECGIEGGIVGGLPKLS